MDPQSATADPPDSGPVLITQSTNCVEPNSQAATSDDRSHLPPLTPSSPIAGGKLTLNDPLTVSAYRSLGFIESDLKYPTDAEINSYTRDPEFKKLVRKQLCDDIDQRIAQVLQERESAASKPSSQPESKRVKLLTTGDLDLEKSEHAENLLKREAEQIIYEALERKYQAEELNRHLEIEKKRKKEEEEEIKKKRKLEKQVQMEKIAQFEEQQKEKEKEERKRRQKEEEKELEFKEKQERDAKEIKRKAKEEEQKRDQKIAQTKSVIQKIEAEKSMRLKEKLDSLMERDKKRMDALQKEEEAMRKTREEDNQRTVAALKSVIANKRKILREMRKKSEERDKRVEDALSASRKQKDLALKARKDKEQEKIERQKNWRDEKEQAQKEKNAKLLERDQKATENLQKAKEEIKEKSLKVRTGEGEFEAKMKEKTEQYQKMMEKKRADMDDIARQKEERLAEAKEKLERNEIEKGLLARIEQEKRKFQVIRAERRATALKLRVQNENTEKQRKIEEIEMKRRHLAAKSKKQRFEMSMEKQDLQEKMSKAIHSASGTDDNELKSLAEKFGLNFEVIENRARNPKAFRKTVSEIIADSASQAGDSIQKPAESIPNGEEKMDDLLPQKIEDAAKRADNGVQKVEDQEKADQQPPAEEAQQAEDYNDKNSGEKKNDMDDDFVDEK